MLGISAPVAERGPSLKPELVKEASLPWDFIGDTLFAKTNPWNLKHWTKPPHPKHLNMNLGFCVHRTEILDGPLRFRTTAKSC